MGIKYIEKSRRLENLKKRRLVAHLKKNQKQKQRKHLKNSYLHLGMMKENFAYGYSSTSDMKKNDEYLLSINRYYVSSGIQLLD